MGTLVIVVVLGGSLLVIFGGLIGYSLSQQWLDGEIRLGAKLRREAGELHRTLLAERAHCDGCPYCSRPRIVAASDGPGAET